MHRNMYFTSYYDASRLDWFILLILFFMGRRARKERFIMTTTNTTNAATVTAPTATQDNMYMVFRVDREYDPDYDTHAEIVTFRGIRRGLGDLFTNPSKSDDLIAREDGSVHAYIYRTNRKVEYLAVPMPTKEGVGPEFAIELFESCH